MAFSEALAERIRDRLAQRKGIEEKKMFGGIGFLLSGNMLVGVWKESLIVRLGPDAGEEALLEPHVKEFDITGRAMKGWVMVRPQGLEEDEQLHDWIDRALKFVATLQAKSDPSNVVLLLTQTRAGHGAGKPTNKVIDEASDAYSFLARVFGMEWRPVGGTAGAQ